jgi:dienelactone hydrolase
MRRPASITVVLLLVLGLAACDGSGSGSAQDRSPSSTPSTPSPSPSESPEAPLTDLIVGTKVVHFRSGDGAKLAGRLFGAGRTGVILSHMGPQGNDQSQWWRMAEDLADRGYLVLTYNYSGVCPRGPALCSTGTTSLAAPAPDLMGAIRFLGAQGAHRLVLGGASMGAMASLKVAARPGVNVSAVVSLSGVRLPQTSYSLGQSTIRQIDEPKLFLAGKFDDEAARAARHWLAWAGAPKSGKILDTGLHGTDMINLASGQDADMPGMVKRSVFRFLAQYAPPGHA